MDKVTSRNEWIIGRMNSIIDDKDSMIRSIIFQMLNKTVKMFKYNGLPDTIQPKDLETQLQVGGFAIWKEVGGKLYTFSGGLGGAPNPYYLPTLAIVANPALRYNASLEIDKECVVMLNDFYYQGLMPLFNKYANLLTEAELSLKYAIINARVPAIIQADNDVTYESAKAFFDKIVKGKEYGVVLSESFDFSKGLQSYEFYKSNYITDIIESIQYIKGSWYNELGLNAAFNMKREAINEAEATLNEDILIPTIDAMLQVRKDALEKVNEMFGTNITVELDSIWHTNREHDELALEMEEAEIENLTSNDTDTMEGGDENETERDSNEEREDSTD